MKWLLLILFLLIVLNLTHLFYFNIYTHSLPTGIYMRVKGIPKIGEYASTCLTPKIAKYGISRGYLEEGNCNSGAVHVLKIIKGLQGDHFFVKNGLLFLNGHSYRIMENDSYGRKLKIFYKSKEEIIDKNHYMLLSDFVQNSWDSRYFGPVTIQFLLKPLWIFENDHLE